MVRSASPARDASREACWRTGRVRRAWRHPAPDEAPRRDEANLSENEKIKKELNPTKISEPKTPYLSPMETDEELDLMGKRRCSGTEDTAGLARRQPGVP